MFKYFIERKQMKTQLLNISNKFASNDIICKDMLELLDNKETNVKLDKDIKNNYYVFLNNTIYLSGKEDNKNAYQRICIAAHECMHSIQNKIIQIINFILSNVELMGFVISLICILFKFNNKEVFYSYLILNIISAFPRLVLEIDATIKSISLSKKYMLNKIDTNEINILIKAYKTQMLILFPIFIISLLFGRIMRIVLLYILMCNAR